MYSEHSRHPETPLHCSAEERAGLVVEADATVEVAACVGFVAVAVKVEFADGLAEGCAGFAGESASFVFDDATRDPHLNYLYCGHRWLHFVLHQEPIPCC